MLDKLPSEWDRGPVIRQNVYIANGKEARLLDKMVNELEVHFFGIVSW